MLFKNVYGSPQSSSVKIDTRLLVLNPHDPGGGGGRTGCAWTFVISLINHLYFIIFYYERNYFEFYVKFHYTKGIFFRTLKSLNMCIIFHIYDMIYKKIVWRVCNNEYTGKHSLQCMHGYKGGRALENSKKVLQFLC